jgi:hypothetical protein
MSSYRPKLCAIRYTNAVRHVLRDVRHEEEVDCGYVSHGERAKPLAAMKMVSTVERSKESAANLIQ